MDRHGRNPYRRLRQAVRKETNVKSEQNFKKEYEPPELRLVKRHFSDFLEISGGNRSEFFENDPFDGGFGISF